MAKSNTALQCQVTIIGILPIVRNLTIVKATVTLAGPNAAWPALYTNLIIFEIEHSETKLELGQTWTISSKGDEYFLDNLIANGPTVIKVDWQGKISILNAGNASKPHEPANWIWEAYRANPTTTYDMLAPQYIAYTPTPAGIYLCTVDEQQKNILCALQLIARQPNIPTSPVVIDCKTSDVSLVGIKLSWQTAEYRSTAIVDSNAIQMYRETSSEFPISTSIVAAFPLSTLRRYEVIFCAFKTNNPTLARQVVNVRAIRRGWPDSYTITCQAFSFWTDLHGEYWYSSYYNCEGFIQFNIDTEILFWESKTVGIFPSDWLWQSTVGDPARADTIWKDIALTPFELCLTLAPPQYPWNAIGNEAQNGNNSQHSTHPVSQQRTPSKKQQIINRSSPSAQNAPYAGLVRKACLWARGATNQHEAAKKIIEGLTDSGIFVYDPNLSLFVHYEVDKHQLPLSPCDPNGGIVVNGTRMVETLEGMLGEFMSADCVDLSHLVMLLANSIGCNMKVGRLENLTSVGTKFNLELVQPLGSNKPLPDQQFIFHEVAYIGDEFDDDALVFDPCLKLCFPIHETPTYAMGMRLSEYLSRLVGCNSPCGPKIYSDCPERITFI